MSRITLSGLAGWEILLRSELNLQRDLRLIRLEGLRTRAIARAVARRPRAFGIKRLTLLERSSMDRCGVLKADSGSRLYAEDFVTFHLPLTQKTRHSLTARKRVGEFGRQPFRR